MRHLHSEFHFCHTLFALQGPDGYVDALLEPTRSRSRTRRDFAAPASSALGAFRSHRWARFLAGAVRAKLQRSRRRRKRGAATGNVQQSLAIPAARRRDPEYRRA